MYSSIKTARHRVQIYLESSESRQAVHTSSSAQLAFTNKYSCLFFSLWLICLGSKQERATCNGVKRAPPEALAYKPGIKWHRHGARGACRARSPLPIRPDPAASSHSREGATPTCLPCQNRFPIHNTWCREANSADPPIWYRAGRIWKS